MRSIFATAVAIAITFSMPTIGYASLACPQRPCDTRESCEKVADWVVEGTFTVIVNMIWLENAVLVRGNYPVPRGTTYLADASRTCYPVLPDGILATTAAHLVGKRVRAYGSSMRTAYVDAGVVFIETIPADR